MLSNVDIRDDVAVAVGDRLGVSINVLYTRTPTRGNHGGRG